MLVKWILLTSKGKAPRPPAAQRIEIMTFVDHLQTNNSTAENFSYEHGFGLDTGRKQIQEALGDTT